MSKESITSGKIKIKGGPEIKLLTGLEYQIEANEHATAIITGVVEEKEKDERIFLEKEQEIVTVVFETEQGEETAFSGYLNEIKLQRKTGIPMIMMRLNSGSTLLDRRKRERSYQDTSISYAGIVKEAIKEAYQAVFVQ